MNRFRQPSASRANLLYGLMVSLGVAAGALASSTGVGILVIFLGLALIFLLHAKYASIWACGPSKDELKEAVANFKRIAVNDDRFYMHIGAKEANLYKETSMYSYVVGVELPWEDWRDEFRNQTFRHKLHEKSSLVEEGHFGCYVASTSVEGILEIIDCLLEELDASLEELEFRITFRSGGCFDGVRGRARVLKPTPGIDK